MYIYKLELYTGMYEDYNKTIELLSNESYYSGEQFDGLCQALINGINPPVDEESSEVFDELIDKLQHYGFRRYKIPLVASYNVGVGINNLPSRVAEYEERSMRYNQILIPKTPTLTFTNKSPTFRRKPEPSSQNIRMSDCSKLYGHLRYSDPAKYKSYMDACLKGRRVQ